MPVTWMTSSCAQGVGELGGLGVFLGAEDALGEALAVAEVDEDDAAVVAGGIDPADERDGLADVVGAEFVAVVGAVGHLSVVGDRL